jgi:hypothetical protein
MVTPPRSLKTAFGRFFVACARHGAGLQYQIVQHWAVRGQYIKFRQMQSDRPDKEWFSFGSLSLVYTF